jgi:hypothetical protein
MQIQNFICWELFDVESGVGPGASCKTRVCVRVEASILACEMSINIYVVNL